MKVIIAGSRNFCQLAEPDKRKYKKAPEDVYVDEFIYQEDYDLLCEEMVFFQLEHGRVTEVVSGTALGADKAGERWAKENNIPIKKFYPNWKAGKSAGVKRNIEMGRYADAAVVFIRDKSKGSTHMVNESRRRGLITKEIVVKSLTSPEHE
jgi:hypothetical protein